MLFHIENKPNSIVPFLVPRTIFSLYNDRQGSPRPRTQPKIVFSFQEYNNHSNKLTGWTNGKFNNSKI